jgi:hypothetical protein
MATVNYGGFMEVTIGGNAMFSGTGQNEEKKPQLEVGIDPKYTKFSRMSFMEKYGRRSAPTPTKTSGNGPEAVLMKDSNGNVIAGASGSPVYMPKGYSLQMFAQLGAEVYRSSSPSSSSLALSKLPNFRQGGIWDTQRIGGNGRDITDPRFIDGATIAIGVYAASAGVPYPTLMTVMDDYAAVKSNFGPDAQMDEDYHHLAQRNVQNTIIGYELIQSGAIPIPPPPSGY